MWSLDLREGYKLKVPENKVMRKMFGLKIYEIWELFVI
jgi:hypothetical protein